MRKLLLRIYTIYCAIIFCTLFLILYPFFFVLSLKDSWHRTSLFFNKIWAHIFFPLAFIPVKFIYEEKLNKKEKYLFCANHFSYLDIPVLVFLPWLPAFVGKSSLGKIPLFGFVYNRVHITVDRENVKSRGETIYKSIEAIDKGKTLVVFPEGGIRSKNPPELAPFKDGAFRIAIEKQIPLIPVTIAYNWIILPTWGEEKYLFHRHKVLVVIHKPIETKGLTLDDVDKIKNLTYNTIEKELKKQNKI